MSERPPDNTAPDTASRDLAARWSSALALWGPPVVALLLVIGSGAAIKTVTWTLALAWLGIACIWNARRCGRRHCYVTGPYFLVLALGAALHGSGVVSLGSNGWQLLGLALGAGGTILCWLPDKLWGRYVQRTARKAQH